VDISEEQSSRGVIDAMRIRQGKHRCHISGGEYEHRSFSDAVHLYINSPKHREDWALGLIFKSIPALIQWLGGLISELDAHTIYAINKESFKDVITKFEIKWLKLAVALLNKGLPVEARTVLIRWYILLRSQETLHNTRYHKGTTLWQIGRVNKELEAIDSARSFFLLAMFEDIRGDSTTWKTLPARNWLVEQLQVSSTLIDKIGEEATQVTTRHLWNPGEPETIWIRLAGPRRKITRASLVFIKAISTFLFNLLEQNATTKKEIGDRLELLMSYLFATNSGFEVLGSTLSPDAQNDIVIRNRHSDQAISSLGGYLLVECKNWKKRVNSATIREIAGRLQAAGVQTGILVSSSGITGTQTPMKRSGARLTISKEYIRDRTAIVYFDRTILKSLCSGDLVLENELLEVYEKVIFDLD